MARWALVTQVTPSVLIRLPGDTVDVPALQNPDVVLATNDRVVVLEVGTSLYVAGRLS